VQSYQELAVSYRKKRQELLDQARVIRDHHLRHFRHDPLCMVLSRQAQAEFAGRLTLCAALRSLEKRYAAFATEEHNATRKVSA
jgi:hypothetical protein